MANAVATLVVKAVADVKDATSGLDEVTSRSDKMKSGLSTAAKAATGVLIGLGAAFVSAGKAAAEDAQGAALLAQSLTKTTGATKDQIAGVEDWISSMSAATGVADDQLRPALSTLARATGDVSKSQDALKVAMDVAAATGTDVESVSKAIAKGYAGQTTAIGRLVPGLDAATLASGDMTAIMGELQSKMGGSAAAAANTTAGKMQRMTVSFNEAKEAVGAGLLPVMSQFAGIMATVGAAVQNNPKAVTALAIAIGVLAAAVIATNAVVSAWTTIVRIAAAVQWLWNAAMAANPIGLVIIAVVALVAAVILLWKHSETFRGAVTALWDVMQSGAKTVAAVVSTAFATVRNAIATAFNWVKSNWPTILAILTGPIGIAVGLIVKHWDTIKSAAQSAFTWIGNKWDTTVGGLKSAVSGLGAILSKPFDVAQTAAGDVSTAVSHMIGWIAKVVAPAGFAGPFDLAKTAINGVITAVQSLISWLGKIHVPSIHLPHIGTKAAPAPAVASVVGLARAPGVPTARASARSPSAPIVVNVTGAIDPEATARQIQRILTRHGTRVGLAT